MTTKPRSTKKPVAKPKRYVRVAVKARKVTLQESDRPNRWFETTRPPKPTAEDIGRSIGDALGRRLEDLLSKPEKNSHQLNAVGAWTVEKNVDSVNLYKAEPVNMSRMDDAMDRLTRAVSAAQALSEEEKRRLVRVLSSEKLDNFIASDSLPCRPPGLANAIFDLADRILDDNNFRSELLDCLEI